MSDSVKAARYRDVRTFFTGAACGFLAGALAVAVIVWQFGNVVGTRQSGGAAPAPTEAANRWGVGMDDAGAGVLERAAEPTASTTRPPTPDAPSGDGSTASGAAAGSPSELAGRALEIPVEGVGKEQLTRQFADKRGGATRDHEALDILAPRNTPVRAVEDGAVARLFLSKAGGTTIYQFDPTERFCYYYAHLERYADGLKEGDRVKKGQVIGYVGTSGNAAPDTPHLHFAVFRLTAEKHWWEGTPIDPYDILR